MEDSKKRMAKSVTWNVVLCRSITWTIRKEDIGVQAGNLGRVQKRFEKVS